MCEVFAGVQLGALTAATLNRENTLARISHRQATLANRASVAEVANAGIPSYRETSDMSDLSPELSPIRLQFVRSAA